MRTPSAPDSASWKLAGLYREFLMSLAGHFAATVEGSNPTSGQTRSRFRTALIDAASIHISSFAVQVEALTKEAVELALEAQEARLSDPDRATLDEYVAESLDDVLIALSAILHRDVATAERELRRLALNVDLLQSSTGISEVGALIKAKLTRNKKMPFYQQDSLGRSRPSDAFLQTVMRQHFVLTFVEASLFASAKSGNDLAVVFNGKDVKGETFSITGGTPGYLTYEDIRKTVFHPNSSTIVRAA